jgi:hypothetical protein
MVTSVTKAGEKNCPQNVRLSKHTDKTIHWKAVDEHFLMVPLVFLGKIKNKFSEFFSKTAVLNELMQLYWLSY